MNKVTFLGTGHGMPVRSTSTSILIQDDSQHLLCDVAGGHDLLHRFFDGGIDPTEITNVFISHADSDHILGIVPLVRAWGKDSDTKRTIFCSQDVKNAIDSLFTHVAKNHFEKVQNSITFVLLEDRAVHHIGDWQVTFFDIKSSKTPEFGCHIILADTQTVVYCGDEPLQSHYEDLAQNVDVLIHEAFCLDTAKEQFHPHEKHHCTVKEAAENAARMNAKALLLAHMEDRTLETRKKAYTKEVQEVFSGGVFVPVDGDQYSF
ncbi:MAG: hypothetical protein COU32_02445 [Candidatus Magasanikbacteria bacterium CG10_big_fil_rev_8_21_14_0_10_42_10]|uniref:Uncharacterized protein n=2 Tax=Candidatus Magasanikiibacteriota TaxID=1752731 RepID=A0A2H0TXY9_9BACT|nr:MAG: hypothetical protein COU32_02445 [Candidatus Magasanikbacteria bacterium CG10_big_fil_rev_8_21_14_0_10_42_10]PIZ93982.1 MAG: hypothetical protein COX82_01540 [Candidatus Magasanikbacteria bacterium CG_4_10_14_0_2_um_filter_41_10]